MKEYINDLLLFFQFFTRIPIKKNLICEKENFRRGAIFFPVIGLFIGSLQWIIYYFSSKVFNSNITAVFVMIVPLIVTGGLHVDGLGDTCDGFFAFKGGKDRIIEIMKDSTNGTFATMAIVFDMIIKYVLINTVIDKNIPLIIIAAPIISRLTVVFIAFIGKNAKKTGSGNIFIGNIDLKRMITAVILTIIFTVKLVGIKELSILIAAAITLSLLFNKFCESKIDGHTGDTLGANNELVEILVMLVFVGIK